VVADYDRSLAGLSGGGPQTPSDAAVQLQTLVTSAAQELSERLGQLSLKRIVIHLLVGAPANEIVWLAAHVNADLVVVGTHSRKGVARVVLGSVAERVVRHAGCPVHVVRDKQHESAWRVPEIEPPCPDCTAIRKASAGDKLWCERHQSHIRTHVYSGPDFSFREARPWGFSM
jgi:Universal stress protein family